MGRKKNINVHVVRHQTRTHGFSCMCQDKGAAHIAVWCSSRLEWKGHDDYMDFMRSSHIHVRFGSALHAGASQGEGRRERTLLQDVRGACRARPASECPPCPREIKRAARLQCVKPHPPVPEYLFLEHMCFRAFTIMWPFKLRMDTRPHLFVFFTLPLYFIYYLFPAVTSARSC